MRKNNFIILCVFTAVFSTGLVQAGITIKPGPSTIPCFDVFEIIVQSNSPYEGNPFTDVKVSAIFTPDGGSPVEVDGFCDDQKGRCFRIRLCPSLA